MFKSKRQNDFKTRVPFEKRHTEARRILEKYPDRIPVILEKSQGSDIAEITNNKYLVPPDITIGQFIYIIRSRINLSAEKAIYLIVNNIVPSSSITMAQLYKEHKQNDNFVYFLYAGEQTYGCKP